MYRHPTKLFLAGVAVVALFALGGTSIFAPAWAAKPGKLPIDCTEGEIAKWSPLPGGGEGDFFWACAANGTLDVLDCTTDQIAKWDGAAWVCANPSDSTTGSKTVFVTSLAFTGNFRLEGGAATGLKGGDDICQAVAEQGTVPSGTYIAWLSNDATNAIDRLPDGATEYVLHSGTKVADGKADLVDCPGGECLDHAIDEDEDGNVLGTTAVWTGTFSAGQSAGGTVVCDDWTAGSGSVAFGRVGLNTQVFTQWTSHTNLTCPTPFHLYCFQR